MQHDRISADRVPFGIFAALLLALVPVAFGGVRADGAHPLAYVPPRVEVKGKVPTEVFGLGAPVSRVVYVFDASGSMTETEQSAFRASAEEVLQSLGHLGKHQSFGIVVYNETVTTFAPEAADQGAEATSGMVAASRENVRRAAQFLHSVVAKGNARHAEALEAAYAMKPDVVFLVTDSEARLDLTTLELSKIKTTAGKTPCMIVQLGDSKKQSCPNLSRLASETGGRYHKLTYQHAWESAFQKLARPIERDPASAANDASLADATDVQLAR